MLNILIFALLILLSNFLPKEFLGEGREYNLLEIGQSLILLSCFILHFEYRKIFIKVSNSFTFIIRAFFILFVFYEEISFLTDNTNNLFNKQNQFNIHNSYFFTSELFNLKIPFTNIDYTLSLEVLIFTVLLFLIGYGSYFVFLKGIRYLFLEKKFAIYTFTYIGNIILSLFNYPIIIKMVLHDEIIEIFFYVILLLDILSKRKIMKLKRKDSQH